MNQAIRQQLLNARSTPNQSVLSPLNHTPNELFPNTNQEGGVEEVAIVKDRELCK